MREMIIARIKEYFDGSHPRPSGVSPQYLPTWAGYFPNKEKFGVIKRDENTQAMLAALTTMTDTQLIHHFETVILRGNPR